MESAKGETMEKSETTHADEFPDTNDYCPNCNGRNVRAMTAEESAYGWPDNSHMCLDPACACVFDNGPRGFSA